MGLNLSLNNKTQIYFVEYIGGYYNEVKSIIGGLLLWFFISPEVCCKYPTKNIFANNNKLATKLNVQISVSSK